jgi:hypothetical protein
MMPGSARSRRPGLGECGGFYGLPRLRDELDLFAGDVPAMLDAPAAIAGAYQISDDAFLLSLPSGLAFYYRRGIGTTYRRSAETTDDEIALFFDGWVVGAIAWLNGYVPLHASAVLHDGQIFAFTGHSGAGKSTLAAALAQRGMTLCSDDVLLLDLADPAQIVALPGPERIKLWDDALTLTGHRSVHPVRPGIRKFYVSELSFACTPHPVRRLYFLDSRAEAGTGFTAIEGASRFNFMRSAYYRPQLFTAIAGQARYFQMGVRLSRSVEMRRFNRSRDHSDFSAGIDMILEDLGAAA